MEAPSTTPPKSLLQKELARRLAKQEMASGLFSFLGYGPQAYLIKGTVPDPLLYLWVALVMALELTNAAICHFLQRAVDQPDKRRYLIGLLMVTLALSGSVWGSVILLPGMSSNPTIGALQQVAIGIVAIASTQALATHPGCLAAFTLGILGPTVVSGFSESGVPFAFGVAAIGLFLMCQLYGFTTRKLVIDAIHAEHTIRQAKDAAEAANRAKSVFLSNMSHELRTPLNAILGYAQLLSRQESLTPDQRRQVSVMHASGEHLLTLIGDILDLSKIEAQKMSLILAPLSPLQMLEQVLDISRPRTTQKGLALRLEVASPLPAWVQGDERRLRQVLLNLLANATKFTATGSVVLRASYGVQHPHTLTCDVLDTGMGIPGDKLDAIFAPFTQLAPDEQGREGVGLGLPISRSLATLMGGSLEVTSTPGQGSTFRLSVRLDESAEPRTTRASEHPKICGYRGPRRRILVVDDNPVNAVLLQDILTPLGFDTQTATSGQAALSMAEASPPDLVLLDFVMPQWDGLDTVQALRARPELKGVPVIGLSASNADLARKQSFVQACGAFLTKPVQLHDLFQAMERLLYLEWQRDDEQPPAPHPPLFTPSLLDALPPEQREALGDAALSLDAAQVMAVIAGFESAHPVLARALTDWVNRFDFQAILDAIRSRSD